MSVEELTEAQTRLALMHACVRSIIMSQRKHAKILELGGLAKVVEKQSNGRAWLRDGFIVERYSTSTFPHKELVAFTRTLRQELGVYLRAGNRCGQRHERTRCLECD